MAILLIVLGFCAVFLLIATYVIDRSWGARGVCVASAVATILAGLVFPPLALIPLGAFLLSGIAMALDAPQGVGTACCAGVMAILLALIGIPLFSTWSRVERIAAEYPLVSLESRLDYERRPSPIASASPAPLAAHVEALLASREGEIGMIRRWDDRALHLRRLHEMSRADFVVAQGFGVSRMPGIHSDRLQLPPIEPVPQPQPAEGYDPDAAPGPAGGPPREPARPPSGKLLAMHQGGTRDFLDGERMGYVRDRDHVAGFAPHQFSKLPELKQLEEWRVARLELVSLLKHDPPAAYVSKHLPNMEELDDAPTRPLDSFEASALARLRTAEDVVTDESPDRIRMLGSLRAGKDCLACHSVQRGELLGALSYVLVRAARAPRPSPRESARLERSRPPLIGARGPL
jgi:hypothetical protein